MTKFLIIVFSFFLISSYTYASFPVKSNNLQSEVVVSSNDKSSIIAPPTEFHFGGFILGLLLGIIGVGLAYIFSNNSSFRRNAWYGFGTWIIILLLTGAVA
tara:strand:+ start:68 stop:370 length:303 start_codon:yes stop_codon:yes gene_type:complete